MSEPQVSVIIPARDAVATIVACLRSLAAQTATAFEVVLVDDGSTDGTAHEAAHTADDLGLRLEIVHGRGEGRASARNLGLGASRGQYLAFVDADDEAEPAMLERLIACAEETAADLVVCEYLGVSSTTGRVLHHYHEGDLALYGGSVLQRPGLLSATVGSVCNKLIRRSLFADIRFPAGRDFEDLATCYRLMGAARRIEKVPEPLYRYRLGQPASVMGAHDARYFDIFDALDVTNEYFLEAGTFELLRDDLERVNYLHLILGRYDDLHTFGERGLRHRFVSRAFEHMDRVFPGWRRDPAVKEVSGSLAKRLVSTHRMLLDVYSDFRARGRA